MSRDDPDEDWKKKDHRAKHRMRGRMLTDPNLGNGAARIGAILIDFYYNTKYDCAWPSMTTLAKRIGKDRKTVKRYITELVKKGYFTRKVVGGSSTNTYRPVFVRADFEDTAPTMNEPDQSAEIAGGDTADPQSSLPSSSLESSVLNLIIGSASQSEAAPDGALSQEEQGFEEKEIEEESRQREPDSRGAAQEILVRTLYQGLPHEIEGN